jgi:hypothetical protein
MVKEIATRSIGLVIKEAFLFLAIKFTYLARGLFATIINQAAGELEIQRLNKEVPLYLSEFVINNQDSLTSLFAFLALLLWIAVVYIFVKNVLKIIKIFREGE